MSKGADTDASNATWSTWEELLLAFAVKRHGLKDWDTVAMELQNRHRSSLPSTLFTAQICKDRYRYLRQRFTNHHHHHHRNNASTDAAGPGGVGTVNNDSPSAVDSDAEDNNDVLGGGGVDAESLPWLEELRKIRVAELKREVQRYDLSIESLQMKVKTMEEEREKSLSENQNGAVKQPDLDDEIKEERSENDKKDGHDDSPDEAAGKAVSAEDENRSFNESNSTDNRRSDIKTEPEPEREPVQVKPESDSKPVGGEDSCNDSSDRHEVGKASRKREKDGLDSDELRDSVSDSKEGTKESSDVQSSASLMTRKRRRKGEVDGAGGEGGGSGGGEGATVASPANVPNKRESGAAVKSEPFLGFVDNIRSHKHGSVFERRLESQKTDKYKNMIRQHVDLETVQARIDNGSYSSCSTRFYVDLLLLFNNAIVFFPKSSPESLAAYELRQIVTKELKKNLAVEPSLESSPMRVQPQPDPEKPDSFLAQHKSTASAPIIVCRKRSSIQAKASSSVNKVEKQAEDKPVTNLKPPIKSPLSISNEEESPMKLKMKEKPVTGVRSMRRSSKGRPHAINAQSAPSTQNPSSSSQQAGTADKGQASKVDKKKAEEAATFKKRGAADFLKRIKKNDPSKGTLVEALKSSGDNFKGGKRDQPTKKLEEGKDGQARRSGGGGGGKHAKEESSPSKRSVGRPPKKGKDAVVGKRGREGGEGEGSSKRSKKRSRR